MRCTSHRRAGIERVGRAFNLPNEEHRRHMRVIGRNRIHCFVDGSSRTVVSPRLAHTPGGIVNALSKLLKNRIWRDRMLCQPNVVHWRKNPGFLRHQLLSSLIQVSTAFEATHHSFVHSIWILSNNFRTRTRNSSGFFLEL
ncbi:hypothetical protein D3C84_918730 [compost metagenome]